MKEKYLGDTFSKPSDHQICMDIWAVRKEPILTGGRK